MPIYINDKNLEIAKQMETSQNIVCRFKKQYKKKMLISKTLLNIILHSKSWATCTYFTFNLIIQFTRFVI